MRQDTDDDSRARALDALHDVLDPELGIDVVELGLVYDLALDGETLRVQLTMTTPACPLSEQIIRDAEERLRDAGFAEVELELVWDPPWGPERMSPAAKQILGWGQ